MPKRSLIDQLESAVQAMLARPEGGLARPDKGFDPGLAPLLRIARDLRDLPREDFKIRLRTNLKRPYIIVPRAGEFIEFLTNAFAGTERFRVGREPGSELIMHAEVAIGNSIVELADANEQIPEIRSETCGTSR